MSIVAQPDMTDAKVIIDSQEMSREMGEWNGAHGLPCQPDAYHYGCSEWDRPYLRSDYTFAYIQAKGL